MAAAPGSRVRVLRIGDDVPQEATLVELRHDILVIQPGGCCAVDTIPIASLATLDVSQGVSVSPTRVLGGMALGGMAGVGAGWLVTVIGCKAPDAPGTCALAGVRWIPLLAVGGIVAGALWGMESTTEQWERIYPPERVSLLVAPSSGGGVSIGLRLPLRIGSR